jgi:hypothetical protein
MNVSEVSSLTRTLSLADRAAVASLVKASNSDLVPGSHSVDVTVRIRATVTKNADEMARQPQKVNPWVLLALMANKLNQASVDAVIREAIENHQKGEELDPEIKKYVEAAFERLGTATTTLRSGKTTVKGTVEIV